MTTQCNLACLFCGRTYDIQVGCSSKADLLKHQRYLSLDAFEMIIEQIPGLQSVDIQGTGEPLLHPQFAKILALCSAKNIAVEFFTNATQLDNAMAECILNASVQRITFSIDAATPDLFGRIRRGADLQRVSSNIASFMNLLHTSGKTLPHIRVMMVLSTVNLHEISGVLDLCRNWKVNEMVLSKINIPGAELSLLEPNEDALWQAIEGAEVLANQYGLRLTVEVSSNEGEAPTNIESSRKDGILPRCLWPWYSANLLVDGSVTPCAFISYSSAMNMGNVLENGFGAIWNSADYRKLRTAHRTGVWNNQPCSNCRNYVE